MPATNRLSRVAQWQNASLNISDFAAVHESASGTKRTFVAPQHFVRYWRWSQLIDATLYLRGKRWSVW
jgi:hypothetical protein